LVDGNRQRRGTDQRWTPAAGCAGSQTGHVQNYALGIAIGLIIMAGSYLVIASR